MIEFLQALNTNEPIVSFTLNNMILLMLIKYVVGYICKKTPWAGDDDLASFLGGAIQIIQKKKGENNAEPVQTDEAKV